MQKSSGFYFQHVETSYKLVNSRVIGIYLKHIFNQLRHLDAKIPIFYSATVVTSSIIHSTDHTESENIIYIKSKLIRSASDDLIKID